MNHHSLIFLLHPVHLRFHAVSSGYCRYSFSNSHHKWDLTCWFQVCPYSASMKLSVFRTAFYSHVENSWCKERVKVIRYKIKQRTCINTTSPAPPSSRNRHTGLPGTLLLWLSAGLFLVIPSKTELLLAPLLYAAQVCSFSQSTQLLFPPVDTIFADSIWFSTFLIVPHKIFHFPVLIYNILSCISLMMRNIRKPIYHLKPYSAQLPVTVILSMLTTYP